MKQDFDPRRIFIGGIDSEKITIENLKFYFQQYGNIVDATIARTRPVGFVKFESASAVKRVLDSTPHIIEGIKVEVKEALYENDVRPKRTSRGGDARDSKFDEGVRIYLGGLCIKRTTEENLASHFQDFGNVVSIEIKKTAAGVSRGFGFITFDSPSAVRRVISKNPHEIDGKSIEVKRAIPEEEMNPRGGRGRSPPRRESPRRGNNEDINPCKVFLGGLHYETKEEDLNEYFGRFGEIVDAVVMRHPGTDRSKGFGFVTYAEPFMAASVLQKRDHTVNGKAIAVRIPKPKESAGGSKFSRRSSPSPPPPIRSFSPPPPQRRRTEENVIPNMNIPRSPSQKTLVIGDFRVEEMKNRTHPSFFNSVEFVSLGEAKLFNIVDHLEARLQSFSYQVVIIFAISFDITYLTLCTQTRVKVMDLEPEFSLDTLMGNINNLKSRWSERFPNINFVWTIPYVPDIPRFNSTKMPKSDSWNNPWCDRDRMSCKMQLFKCYIEGIKTRWDEDSKNTYYVDLNYVMAMGDPVQLAALQNASFDDSIVSRFDDTVDGFNPSNMFVSKFWNQIQKLEEFMGIPPTPPAPNFQHGNNFNNWNPNNNGNNRQDNRMEMEDSGRRGRSGRPSRFSDARGRGDKRSRNDYDSNEFEKRGKRSGYERGGRHRDESGSSSYSSNRYSNNNYNRRRSRSPTKALLPSPGSAPYDPFHPSGSSRQSREREMARDSFNQGPFFNNQHQQPMNQGNPLANTVRNAASTAIQSQLASQMEHLLPDVIKGMTEKIYSEVMKSMQNKPAW